MRRSLPHTDYGLVCEFACLEVTKHCLLRIFQRCDGIGIDVDACF
jgi:hypothetical protein